MDQVAQIREKIDIVSLISEYIPLKKAGRNFKTNCPFHNEKSPSFVVSSERQIWHCFGCQKGGDSFSFLMEYENLEFPEALRILAKRAGIELKEISTFEAGKTSKKEKIYKINAISAEFYHYLLTNHNVGKKPLEYLLKREIKKETLKTFLLGYAPNMGNALSNYLLTKKGFKKEELVDAGVSKYKGQGELVDFFQGRIIFPLFDQRGNIVGFSGRTLLADFQGSKYINTRETLVYHKGSHFFGLNAARDDIKKEERAIIVEGEFDVISCFQEGFKNVVASKGTALTEDQINLILRFTKKISLCFDIDLAGQDAIRRSLSILQKKGAAVTVIQIQNGKDPDEAIKNDPVSFKKSLKNDLDVYDFLLQKALSSFNKKTAEGKKRISDDLLPFFSQIDNEIIKEHYVKKLSAELDVSFESIIRELDKLKDGKVKETVKADLKTKKEREELLEEYLIALIVQNENSKKILEKLKDEFESLEFKTLPYKKITEHLFTYFKTFEKLDSAKFSKVLPIEILDAFDKCLLLPLPNLSEKDYEDEVEKVYTELSVLKLKDKLKEISQKIKDKEKEMDDEEVENLKKEFEKILSDLQKHQF